MIATHPTTSKRRATIRLVGGGLAMVLASVGGLLTTTTSSASTPAPQATPAPEAITVGAGDVRVERIVYEPGHSSGWHAHSGLHAVDILSGTLTVFDEHCQPRTYGPGDPYVGGRTRHLARNNTSGVVEMSVTYLFPSGTAITEFVVPATAPPACLAR